MNKHGAQLVNPDFKKRKKGSPNSDPSGVSPVHPPGELSSSITDAQSSPPDVDGAGSSVEITSDGAETGAETYSESDEFESDSSSSWVE